MFDLIADNADFLIAGTNTALDVSLLPIMWHQRHDKASTVPLTTSVTATLLWLFLALVFGSISLWVTMVAAIITASLWSIIALQRVIYGKPITVRDSDSDRLPRRFVAIASEEEPSGREEPR